MRKLIIFLMFISVFVLKIDAATYRFVWEEDSTYVEVPLNANIQNYLDIPQAKLLLDDKELVDADISYITTGDWLYLLTDVDTTVVGDYKVWFKAVERKYQPGQCNGYKTLVTFHVVDNVPPKILNCPSEIEYVIGESIPKYENLIQAVDNSQNCIINVIDEVDYKKVGIYDVIVNVTDNYNVTSKTIKVKVIDQEGPVITFLGENNKIVVSLGEEIELKSFFKAIDSVDGDVTNTIRYEKIDFFTEGTNRVSVEFNDRNGNISGIVIDLIIVDDTEPVITLFSNNILLDYDSDFDEFNFLSNIDQAYDGVVDIKEYVIVDDSLLENKVGVYEIYYIYDDKDDDYLKVPCSVHVLSSSSPIVNTQDVEIVEGEVPNYNDYINVDDPSDLLVDETTQIDDSQVNYSKPGTYPVYVTATNSSGLTTTEVFYVTIKEQEKDFDWKIVVIVGMFGYLVLGKVLEFIKKKKD